MMSKQVLVIDDEERIQEVVKICLETLAGWQVVTASSGVEGLLKAEAQKPDAILLDMMIPDMDGSAICEKLHNNPATRLIPIVLLTAKAQTAQQFASSGLGVAGLISKPFDPLELANEVANVLGW